MKQKLIIFLSAILLLITVTVKAQVTFATNFSPAIGTPFVGWDGAALSTPRHLDVKNNFANQNINFFTNNTAVNGSSVQVMTILGNSGPTAGFVGIGLLAPLYPLDVQDNINVNTTGFLNGYRINGFTVLQTPALENVFVGRGSAANFTGSTLGQNTFVGFNAGGSYISSNTSGGDRNTFVGRAAA